MLILVLVVLAGGIFLRPRGGESSATQARPQDSIVAATSGERTAPATPRPVEPGKVELDLSRVESKEHRAQIQRVVDAMGRTGAPPAGVAQGGRHGGKKGVFQNAEGRLPRKASGYWVESDVWPQNGPRDGERLIFGRAGEVYWTRDHYQSFVQLR